MFDSGWVYGTMYSHHHDDDGVCVGGVFRPCCVSKGCSIAYLLSLQVVAATFGNLSLQYVNSRICILIVGLGLSGGLASSGAPYDA